MSAPGELRQHPVDPGQLQARPKVSIVIPLECAGHTLAQAVAAAAGLDHAAALQQIARGAVWLGPRRVQDPERLLVGGEALTIHFAPLDVQPATLRPQDILYEDEMLLALNKRPGVYATMTPWDVAADLLWAARQFLAARDGCAPPLHLAHRLDRDTSGVLLLSKDPAANPRLQAIFADHAAQKRYLALVAGTPDADRFEARTGHGRGPHGLFRTYPFAEVGNPLPHGRGVIKAMATCFTVVERFRGAALIEAAPITGRTHQIRLHLAYLGYPVLGDSRYGGPIAVERIPLAHHLLHAAALDLPHPKRSGRLHLEAPVPPLFADVLAILRSQDVHHGDTEARRP